MAKLNELNYVTTNRFYVEMEGQVSAAFSECSGLDVKIEKDTPYLEGGVNNQQRIFLKHATFGDITLKRGITGDTVFWEWIQQTLTAGELRRRNINILVFNQAGETVQSWKLIGAIPIGWKTPSLKADSNTVALEELVLTFEGLKVFHKDSTNPDNRVDKNSGAQVRGMVRDSKGYFPISKE